MTAAQKRAATSVSQADQCIDDALLGQFSPMPTRSLSAPESMV